MEILGSGRRPPTINGGRWRSRRGKKSRAIDERSTRNHKMGYVIIVVRVTCPTRGTQLLRLPMPPAQGTAIPTRHFPKPSLACAITAGRFDLCASRRRTTVRPRQHRNYGRPSSRCILSIIRRSLSLPPTHMCVLLSQYTVSCDQRNSKVPPQAPGKGACSAPPLTLGANDSPTHKHTCAQQRAILV